MSKPIIQKDANEYYHNQTDYIGASSLKKYKRSPLHYREQVIKETETMQFGTAYHSYILEPETFEDEYFIFDDSEKVEELSGKYKNIKATKDYKEWAMSETLKANGKKIVNIDILKQLEEMKNRLFAHPYAKYLLTKGDNEKSIYTEVNGVKVKVRPDSMFEKKKVVVDLKTTNDASEEGFKKKVAQMDYQIQAALYSDVCEFTYTPGQGWRFFWIAQETNPPYAFNIFKASPQIIATGQYEYELCLQQHKFCLENEKWEGYQVFAENKFGIQEIDLPAYAIKELNFYNEKS